jgi:mevalonate kinase
MSIGYAPGKVILFGEHAVVYRRPAIAVPVTQVRTQATVEPGEAGTGITLVAPDLDRVYALTEASSDDPLRAIVERTISIMRLNSIPDIVVTVQSTIPIACGMGSGTAVSVSVVRALAEYFARPLPDEIVSELTFEVEKIYHGTPSGIDNTVVTYRKPVYFVKGQPIETISVKEPFHLIIADTGICSPTRIAVGDVFQNWQREPQRYGTLFDQIGWIAQTAREAIEIGDPAKLGRLMNENQRLLREIDVSGPELEVLIESALRAGASGAKLSGAGRGGNMIALSNTDLIPAVEEALRKSGAKAVIVTEVS